MNTYILLWYFGDEPQYEMLTGDTAQDAVELFRASSAAPVFSVWRIESEVDWQ